VRVSGDRAAVETSAPSRRCDAAPLLSSPDYLTVRRVARTSHRLTNGYVNDLRLEVSCIRMDALG